MHNALSALEPRLLLATIQVSNYGARPNDGINDTSSIHAAINASAPGDTIQFAPGRYNIDKVTLKGSRNYIGGGATIDSSSDFAFSGAADSKDYVIKGFRFERAGIAFGAGSSFANILITENTFANMSRNAIKMTVKSDRAIIERNTFIDIRAYGTIEAYTTTRMSYSYNRIIDSAHGGHIIGPLDDCKFNYNRISGAKKMGLEIQRNAPGTSVSKNMEVIGNIVYGWKLPTNGAMGLSIIAEGGLNTRIANNYISNSFAPGSGFDPAPGGPLRQFGPAFETGFATGVIENNTSGGPNTFVAHIAVSGQNSMVRNNKMYGTPSYGPDKWIAKWPGINGYGTFIDQNNLKDTNRANTPTLPQVAGDADGSGLVDSNDLNILAGNFGKTNATWSHGDFNSDRVINTDDFNILAGNFGRNT
jgi:hypothetical protein